MKNANTLSNRASVYTLLSLIFSREITRELLGNLLNEDLLAILDAGGNTLKRELAAAAPEEMVERLAVEFTRLFIGPAPLLYPYESANLGAADGEPGMLWGEATVDVKKFIEFHGLKFKRGYGGIPDHIGIELEFMANLIHRERELLAEGDPENASCCVKAQEYFFDRHIASWIPRFCEKLKEMAGMEFYRAIAGYAVEFLGMERDLYRERARAAVLQPQ